MEGPLGTTRLKAQPCPNCSYKLDAVAPVEKSSYVPKPNDYTVCINCQQILQFDAMMILRKRRYDEVDDEAKLDIARIIITVKKMLPILRAQRN